MTDIGEKLKKLRQSADLNQSGFAAEIGVHYQTVSKWEKGQSVPDSEMLVRLAEIFEVPVSQLLGGPIEPDAQPDALAEQLARINEQLVIKNRRSKRVWKTIGIIAACAIIANILFVGLMLLFSYTAYENLGSTVVTQAAEQIID